MKVLVQRSKYAECIVDNQIVGKINKGLVLFVGFTEYDSIEEIDYMVRKVLNLRIFDDENGIMNKSILEVDKASILSISQFTLYGDCKKGNRPSYVKALNGNEAKKLYDIFNQKLRENIIVETGIFGAEMEIHFTNDGPVTIMIER